MAEVVASSGTIAPDDDEKYLYGDEPTVKDENGSNGHLENGEVKKEAKADDDEDGEFDESDDDDDNIQVHIGEVNASATGAYGTPVSWKKDGTGATKAATLPTQGQKKIDVNTVGLINGQPIYEYDIDSEQDEKPWRKPGADISDYFNYGFTEDTWKQYCEKQRRMRMESNRGPYTVTTGLANPIANSNQVEIEILPDGRTRLKAGPPPDRKVEGSIHVLGSDADARRKQKEDELLALALGQPRVMTAQTFPGQRPLYTALPGGAMMYNPLAGQQMIQPPATSSSHGETSASENSLVSSQGQQIQSIGAPMMNLPHGMQFLPPGNLPMGGLQPMGGPQIFPPPHGMGMDFPPPDPFLHPGMPPGFGGPFGHSDDDFDSDGENRRHRSRRDPSRHRRHRDRGERDLRVERDRDRDRSSSRRENSNRDRSESRSRRDHSKATSERKKHSSRSSSIVKVEDDDNSERKSRSSRRSSKQSKEEDTSVNDMIAEIKQEPVGD